MATLLSTTLNKGLHGCTLFDIGETNALGAMKFVRAAGRKMYRGCLEVQRQVRHGLNRIHMEVGSIRLTERRKGFHIHQRTDFIVGVHKRNHHLFASCLVGVQALRQPCQIVHALRIVRHVMHCHGVILIDIFRHVGHCVVFQSRGV